LSRTIDGAARLPATHVKQTLAGKLTDLLPWVMSLWLILMTGWYVATLVKALEHPLNNGDELMWVWVWSGFVVAVVSSHLLIRRRFITLIWWGLLTAAAIAMVVLSHQITAALITGWFLLLSWSWGDWTLRLMGVEASSPPLDRAPVALPIGLAFLSMVALALSLTHGLTSRWAWLVSAALTIVQWRSLLTIILDFRRLFISRPLARLNPELGIIVTSLGFVFLLDFCWALAPEVQYDALSAHLPVARYYAEHSVVLLSYGYVAQMGDNLFALALSLHGPIVVKLLVLASSVLTAFGVNAIGRMLFSPRVGMWAAALFFSTPLVSWLSSTAYVDGVVTMFLLSSLVAFVRWRENHRMGWLWASGLLTGAALATKLNALLGLPVIGLILLWDLIRSRQPALERLKGMLGYLVAIAFFSAPGFALAYALTGNPFHPLPVLKRFLGKSADSGVSLISNANDFGVGTSPDALLNLPFALTFETRRFGEGLEAGAVGLALLLVPLVMITVIFSRTTAYRAAMLVAVCLVYFGCLAFTMQYARYYVPILPVVAVLAAGHLVHTSRRWLLATNLALLGVVVAAQAALLPLMYWNLPERFPIAVVLGKERREAFLRRVLPLYPATQFLNSNVEHDQKVIGIGTENIRYYLNAEMATRGHVEELTLLSTPPTLAATLLNNGYTYMLVNRSDALTAIPLSTLTPQFLEQFTHMEYTANNASVYRLQGTPIASGPLENLLVNPSFETLDKSSLPMGWFAIGKPQPPQDNVQAHSGTVAIKADADGGFITSVPIQPGKLYSLGHWTRSDLPNQLARLQINWMDAESRNVGVSIDVVKVKQTWTWHKLSAMAPEGAKHAVIYVSVHEKSQVWFDDYVFVQGQLETPSQ
jgi:dolichyl-phosphate-mannose-protein mannosyltransferase